ncbi:MAG: DNA helicase RecQ [Bacteroidales bacterium]|nr:DNA helicase RecQ [Bacteroidales bacterium]
MSVGAEISLKDYLKKYFGFDRFKGNQEAIIRSLLTGHDTFVVLPTGGGKSLCYQLPSLITEGTAIVISPLIALMKNQVDAMRGFSSDEGVAHFLNSSLSKTQMQKVKEDVLNKKTKLLYVAPESLTKEDNVDFLKQANIAFYAIDEAHCISEWGHDFRPEYRRIRPMVDSIGRAPIIALTATATPKVQHDIQKNLGILDAQVFKSSFNRPNLYYEVRPKKNATKEIIKFIKNNPGKSGIVYCLSRKKVEELAETLKVNGIKALPYHAGMDSATRTNTQDKFLMEDIDVIVATIAFGMGIDKPDIRFVIHYNIPKSLEAYYQETGRAGRDDGEGKCIAFYTYKDIQKLEKFMQGKPINEQEIGKQLLLETTAYAESSVCRRRQLLHYFGEEYHEQNCQNCDNCLHPKEQFEGKEYLVKVLKAVQVVKEKFKHDHIANFLAGETTNTVKSYGHDNLEFFGAGKDYDADFWKTVIRRAMVKGLLDKDIINYGLLRLSDRGREYLDNPYSIMISKDHDYDHYDDNEGGQEDTRKRGTVDNELLSILKDLRKKVAKEHNLPPFIIFQDFSLEDMAIQYPVSIDEMNNIAGVGTGKAQKYGEPFINLIKDYVAEKDIIRAQDMVVKSVVNKSGLKVSIIQSIDRQMPLEDIAKSKGLEMTDLLDEIESIVQSGTKLNLDYYIDQVIDEEKQEDIYEYFLEEAETESVKEAIEELGEDEYSEEDIRLMRIKFFSEYGN